MAYRVYYDKVTVTSGSSSAVFFAHNEADDGELVTNLATDNQLPEDFTLERIELIVPPSASPADVENIMKGIIKIKVGTDEPLKFPAALAFSDNHMRLDAEPGNTGTAEYTAAIGTLGGIQLTEALSIPANTKFNIYLITPSGMSADTDLVMALHGRA